MSEQLKKLEERKKKIDQRIKEARKRERERTKKHEEKRLQAMGRFVRDNDELFKRFIAEGAPKLPAYLRKMFEEEIKAGGPVKTKKSGSRKTKKAK